MSVVAQAPARPRRRWIWTLVALATAVVLVMPVAFRLGLKADLRHETVPFTQYSARQVTAIKVAAPGGSITVRPDTAGLVTVASSLSWLLTRPVVQQVRHGRTLAVTAACPQLNPFEDCGIGLTIYVPAGTPVQANIGSGSLSASGLSGPLRVTATTGSIMLTHDSGPVQASATAGSINGGAGLTSPRVAAAVGAGWLALRFASAPQSLALTVGTGGGRVALPPGTACRISKNGPGVLRFAAGLAEQGSACRITVHVGRGALALAYLPGATAHHDAAGPGRPKAPDPAPVTAPPAAGPSGPGAGRRRSR